MTSLHLCCMLISMVRSPLILLLPSSLSPPVPFLSYCPPPSSPLFLHPQPPILPPSHHSLTLMPSSPSLKALDPVTPSPHVALVHIKTSTHFWRPELDTVAYIIYRVKQTIVHTILSRSVHQITYGDVIKAFL